MFRITDDKNGRTKTFDTPFDIDCFTHSYEKEFLHEMVSETLYEKICYKNGFKEQWDDGTDMDASDWVTCVNLIYDNFG